MNDFAARQERFMKHAQPRRLGNLSTNLNRIAAYAEAGSSATEILYFITESKHFAEWSALEADFETQVQLCEMQRAMAKWTIHWQETWNDQDQRDFMKAQARAMSHTLLQQAGLI
jgi:hypothetical protein